MKLMKKKGREREEARKNTINKSLSVVMAAVLVSSVMMAFVPLAVADISSFTIWPDTGISSEVSAYRTFLMTTPPEFSSLNIALPAGFRAQAPTIGGVLIARVDLWNNTLYYGYVTCTANGSDPSNKVDVCANIGGDIAESTINVDYSLGGATNVGSPFGGASHATLTLPTDSTDGSVDVSLPMGMRHVLIDIKEFVKNPVDAGYYDFTARTNVDPVGMTEQVLIGAIITGNVREADCSILPDTMVELFKDTLLVDSTITDHNGNYSLFAPELGDYSVNVSKSGYMSEGQMISVTATVTLNFSRDHGLTPEDPEMSYALKCVNHWLYAEEQPEECRLSMSKALEVVNAWLY